MAPVSSITLAASSASSPARSGSVYPAPVTFGPRSSDDMPPCAAAKVRRLLRALTVKNHRTINITSRQSAQRANCTITTGLWLSVHSGAEMPVALEDSCLLRDEGFEHRADVVTHDEVRDVVEVGRLAIDDDEPRAVALCHHRKS